MDIKEVFDKAENGTLTFGKEYGSSCEIILSFEIYPNIANTTVFHSNPNLESYWEYAKKQMANISIKKPMLYARILDMLTRNNFSIDRFVHI